MEDPMRKASLAAATLGAAAALLAGPALADGFSYNNIEARFISTEIEDVEPGVNLDGDGFEINGSVEFGSTIHGFAALSSTEYEDAVDVGALSVGLGFNHSLAPALDLVSGVSYERLKVEVGSERQIEEGVGVHAGLRGRVGDRVELTAGLKYSHFGDDLHDTTIQFGGRYYFSRNFALGLDYSENDDGDTWALAFRYDFGNRY
jgi:hypothetical protein